MKSTQIAATLLTCVAAPALAADHLYYVPVPAMAIAARAGNVYQEPNTVRAVQYELLERGYTVPIDGVFDEFTANALRHFQQLQGFAPTGVIDQPTLTSLGIGAAMPATIR